MNKKHIFLGISFLVLQIVVLFHSYSFHNYFWICNNILILFSIGFFLKKTQFIKGLVSVAIIPQLIWLLDFIFLLFFKINLFGFTNYVLELENTFFIITTFLVHLFNSFLALLFTFKQETKKISLVYSFSYALVLGVLTYIFTPKEYNVNCIHEMCGDLTFMYSEFFVVFLGVLIIFFGYCLQVLLYNLYKKNKKS